MKMCVRLVNNSASAIALSNLSKIYIADSLLSHILDAVHT